MDSKGFHPLTLLDETNLSAPKERLRAAAREVDFLAPLRRHPALTVFTAAAIGMVAAAPEAESLAALPVANTLRQTLVRFATNHLHTLIQKLVPTHHGDSSPVAQSPSGSSPDEQPTE